jgi:4'-phosphopantetheinyl transferase
MRDQTENWRCPDWSIAPIDLAIGPGQVHLWLAQLNLPTDVLTQLARSLAPDEQQRAARFRFDRDRDRFTAGRGILRQILSRYLQTEAAALEFSYTAHGKPTLKRLPAQPDLQFNVSHSQTLLLCAVTVSHRVGVDLEALRSITDLERLTRRFFSQQEYETIQALPVEERPLAFFQYWTCKEAILKAIGAGLVALESVELDLTLPTARVLRLETDSSHSQWQIHAFSPATNFAAAVAIESPSQLAFWQWQPKPMNELI